MIALSRAGHGDEAVGPFPHGVVEAGATEERRDVVARAGGLGAVCAVARQGGVNQALIPREQRFRIEAVFLLARGEQVAEENLGPVHELPNQLLPLRLGEVDSDGSLAPVVDIEAVVVVLRRALVDFRRATHAAHGVAAEGLDLDHLCTQVREHGAAAWGGHPVGDLDDGNIVHGCVHCGVSPGAAFAAVINRPSLPQGKQGALVLGPSGTG